MNFLDPILIFALKMVLKEQIPLEEPKILR